MTTTTTHTTNVVVILADDMGYSDVGCYGGEIVTPNIDRLAMQGSRFTDFYNTARCSPSRASLLTGLHPHQTGIGILVNPDGPGGYLGSLNDSCATMAETYRAAGYATSMSGKWHLSADRSPNPTWPTRRGFNRFWGTISGAGSYFTPSTLHEGETPVDLATLDADFYYTDAIGDHAARSIRENAAAGKPFFSYVAFSAPHWPLHAREADIARYDGVYEQGWDDIRQARHRRLVESGLLPEGSELSARDPHEPAWDDVDEKGWEASRMRAYAAQVSSMDRAIGAILEALDEAGVADNTIVVFLSDNGGCAESLPDAEIEVFRARRHIIPESAPDGSPMRIGNEPNIVPGPADTYSSYGRAWANVSNAPFRLYKRWVHEGGIATPLIVRWPAGPAVPGSIVRAPGQLTDIAPTLFEATGVPALTHRGQVPLPPLPGTSLLNQLDGADSDEHPLFWEHLGNAAAREGPWKIVREYPGEWELYDIENDRAEMHNVKDGDPDRVAAMASRWQAWADRVGVIPREQIIAVQKKQAAAGIAVIGAD